MVARFIRAVSSSKGRASDKSTPPQGPHQALHRVPAVATQVIPRQAHSGVQAPGVGLEGSLPVLGLVCRMSVEEMVEMGRQTTPPSRLKKTSSQPIDFSHEEVEEGEGPSMIGGGQAPGGGLELVWGPIHASETLKAGAHAAVCSLVVRLQLPASLHERLEQEVLSHTRPFDGDTALSLQERLGKGTFYDDFRAMVGGKHGRAKYVYMNKSQLSQPRRVTMSEPQSEPYFDSDDFVQDLLMYPHFYRHRNDHMCRPTLSAVKELCDVLFSAVRCVMFPICTIASACAHSLSLATLRRRWSTCSSRYVAGWGRLILQRLWATMVHSNQKQ